jgi:hypothetical protein
VKPDVGQILSVSALQLLSQIAPLLPTGYSQGTASLLAVLAMMAAQEYERGAEIRVAENADIRALFAELAPMLSDATLKASLLSAAGNKDTTLTISALDTANYELRRLLIALQSHIEDRPEPEAREAERRIWNVLRASAERRLVRAPM